MNATPDTADNGPAVRRVRHELKRRQLTVLRTEDLGPGLRRVVFGGEELADFVSLSFDDHVKLLQPGPGEAPALMRDYTPRRFDAAARELSIDFVLHEHGPATDWARQAAPGQTLGVGGPRGSFVLPDDLAWHWLIGDTSAVPAIARRLEELPAGAPVRVLLLEPDAAARVPLASAAQLQLQWVDDAAALLAALRAWPAPPGTGFAWAAGEAALMAAVRPVLVDELGLDRRAVRAAAYWKRGSSAHHEVMAD